jgi:DNA (cytosine-5)-methyltransferase 1
MKANFKFIDLFSGIGGFHLALGASGGECVFASEWEKNAQESKWDLRIPEAHYFLM